MADVVSADAVRDDASRMELRSRPISALTPRERVELIDKLQMDLRQALEAATGQRDRLTELVRRINELSAAIRADRQHTD
jgi:hypothetical protein